MLGPGGRSDAPGQGTEEYCWEVSAPRHTLLNLQGAEDIHCETLKWAQHTAAA